LISWALEKFFSGFESFYDFGVGTGSMLSRVRDQWPSVKLFGSDLSSDSLAIVAKRVPGAFLFRTDVNRIPFKDNFDVIGAFDVIEHLDDDIAALKALRLTLKPGGGLAVTVPQHMILWSRLDDMRGHKRRYVGDGLARTVRAAGFDILLDTSFMATLFLPQYVSRRFLSQDAGTELEAEYRLPAFVNGALKAVLMAELATVRMGMRYPFGGMRMVIARNPLG
jgi:SAM-dependent methyltransferase